MTAPENAPAPAPLRRINLAHPRQDVHRERASRPGLHRYRIAERLLRGEPAGLKILECGGSSGDLADRIRDLGHDITIVDLNPRCVASAERKGFAAHCLDLNDGLPLFGDAVFDGIVALEIVEHVVAAERLFAEMARVLKPGGFLVLSTPNFAFVRNRLRVLFGRLSRDEGYHYRFFTASTLEKRLREASFAVEARRHTAPATGLNFFWNRILKRRRIHLLMPRPFAPLLAKTLFVKARRA